MTTIHLLLRMRCEFDCMSFALFALLIVVVLPHTYIDFFLLCDNYNFSATEIYITILIDCFTSLLLLHSCQRTLSNTFRVKSVENNGFEPLTLCVQGRCSSQLS